MKSYDHYENIRVEKSEGIARLTLNRPDFRNAISHETHKELEQVWLDLSADDEVKVIIFTGEGKTFSAGGDVKNMARRAGSVEGLKFALKTPGETRRMLQNILEVRQPIIAAVNGDCVGLGATLALFCDITVIANEAKFGDTHVKVGLVAGDGGAVIWPMLIGPGRAKDFLMRGRLISGAETAQMGITSYAVPAEEVMDKAIEIAMDLARLPEHAVQWTKLSVNKGLKDQLNLILDASIAYEMLTLQTHDHKEAATAFAEKRRPVFKGY